MATTAKNVVVIQDASKVLNLRVFYWITKALSLEPEDMVTVVAILHEVYTPSTYSLTDLKFLTDYLFSEVLVIHALKKEKLNCNMKKVKKKKYQDLM